MNASTENLTKSMSLGAISPFFLETAGRVGGWLPGEKGERPAGLACHALQGVRSFDQDVSLGLGGLIGARDHQKVKAHVSHLGALTESLIPVPGKYTSRTQGLLAPADHELASHGQRPISWEEDLNGFRWRQMLSLTARSRGCLLGDLPVELTEELLTFGRRVGTFTGLVAAGELLGHLDRLEPHALFLDLKKARQATGLAGASPEAVFTSLVERSGASHLLVMTGGGTAPTFVADRVGGRQWTLDPVSPGGQGGKVWDLTSQGASGRLAGTVTFLLGLRRPTVSGEPILRAVELAREVALAHAPAPPMLRRWLRARYLQIRPLFDPDTHEPENVAAA